jgi:2-hydroxychromene-2-carboxylate isomerase
VTFEFWFDFASTYSYLAALRIEEACAGAKLSLVHRPFLLGPIFQEQLGIKDSPFNVQPVRGRYMWRDLERLCAKYGLPWRKPTVFPRHSVLAARVACCAGPEVGAVTQAIFKANFAEDRDISSPDLLREVLGAQAGLVEKAQSEEAKPLLRKNTAEARRLGIFGAPDFVVRGAAGAPGAPEAELFFGHDRMDDALAWAARPGR